MESQPDRQVLPGPAKATPALPGEQVAFKEFETPWNLAGSGRGMAHLAPGAGDNFRAFSISEGLLRYLIPLAGSFRWLAGRASVPLDQKLWDWVSPWPGHPRGGDHTGTCRRDLGWQEAQQESN